MVGFMTNVRNLMSLYGFTRKEAVLITRIERGIDSLEYLCKLGILRQAEYYHVSQCVSCLEN